MVPMLQFRFAGCPPLIDWPSLDRAAADTPLQNSVQLIYEAVESVFTERPHGELERWKKILSTLPEITPDRVELDRGIVCASSAAGIDHNLIIQLKNALQLFHPWRKGPYSIHGIEIDTEWRSDWKWERLESAITPLNGRLVLDVGCGNGYHLWRMAGAGARLALGIDPTQLYLMQFLALRCYLGPGWPVQLLPLGVEQLPPKLRAFDTLFSMGVLYHRRSPIDHLLELKACLRPGGELVLETLVVEGDAQRALVPGGRYAKMRNVWFIPSPDMLAGWMKRCGYRNIRLIDVSRTTTAEQRPTEWMRFESLADFLLPDDPTRTIEGYPAPQRAIFIAESS